MGGPSPTSPSISSVDISSVSQGTFSPKFQQSFLYLKGHFPHQRRGRGGGTLVGVELSVGAFEAVVWLPAVKFAASVFHREVLDSHRDTVEASSAPVCTVSCMHACIMCMHVVGR